MPTTVTKTVKTSGGHYTSLSAWEAGEQANLVSLDEVREAECYSMADTTAVTVDGFTTDATRYVRIYTPTSERHDGKWNTSKYRLEITTAGPAIWLADASARAEGIQVQVTASSGTVFGIRASDADGIRVSACIAKGVLTGSAVGRGFHQSGTNTARFWNNLAFDWTTSGSIGWYQSAAGTSYVYNCTVVDGASGFWRDAGTVVVKNCLAQGNGDGFSGTFDAASTNNCSDIASDAPGSNPSTGAVTFVDEAGDDFHLAAGDAFAKDLGVDLSADANLAFSDDIDGGTRVAPWSIGADQIIAAAAGGAIIVNMQIG